MRKEGTIRISLKSDLCIGSGYAYAGIIDSDICYDAYGIPYIPAKRIKGCMREAAERTLYTKLTADELAEIFGTGGQNSVKGIVLENAYIKGYEAAVAAFEKIEHAPEFADYVTRQNVLDCFTAVKAQTRLDKNGVAEDNSLRYTRTVHAYEPMDGAPMEFLAKIYFDDADGSTEKKLSWILRATRQLGMNRNRGLGSVRCELTEVRTVETVSVKVSGESEKRCVVKYTLRNVEALMLSNGDDGVTEKLIRGQVILGMLASRYLAVDGHTAEDEAFRSLFLRGEAQFTNAVCSRDGECFFPAPMWMNKLKKTGKLVNVQFSYNKDCMGADYDPADGNQPKKLKGKFVNLDAKDGYEAADVETGIIYHHSHRGSSRSGKDSILYSLEVVAENQAFSGEIHLPEKYADLVTELLQRGEIRIGKSRSAQYGKCVLEKLAVEEENVQEQVFAAGSQIAVTLLSDAVFMGENDYTVYCDTVYPMLAKQLGIRYVEREANDKGKTPYSMLQTKLIFGYQATWNLRKVPVPAIAAGSVFVYQLAEDAKIARMFVGEKNMEGLGQIRIDSMDEMTYELKQRESGEECGQDEQESQSKVSAQDIAAVRPLVKKILLESMMEKMKLAAIRLSEKEKIDISASTLGRVTLMLSESMDMHKDDKHQVFAEFVKRIESVKRASERAEMERKVLSRIAKKEKANWILGSDYIKEDWKEMPETRLLKKAGYTEDECRKMIEDMWDDFLMTILVDQKYDKKYEKKEA